MQARRLPLDPVLEHARRRFDRYDRGQPAWKVDLAACIGTTRRQLVRWQADGGIPVREADRVACRLGVHPSFFWGPDWFEAHDGESQRLCP